MGWLGQTGNATPMPHRRSSRAAINGKISVWLTYAYHGAFTGRSAIVADGAVAGEAGRRDRLAARRKALGLTQEQLAELLQVGRTTVARWERGEAQPQPWLRPKLARALGVSAERVEDLLAARRRRAQAGPGRAARRGSCPRRRLISLAAPASCGC